MPKLKKSLAQVCKNRTFKATSPGKPDNIKLCLQRTKRARRLEIIQRMKSRKARITLASTINPYLDLIRLKNQIGTYLLYFPCTWSTALAASPGSLPDINALALFGLGAFVMRNAGCIVNDLWDRDFDKDVERTKNRPLACGKISVRNATSFFVANCLVGFWVLTQLRFETLLFSLFSVPLVIAYPYMKRVTHYPQAFLGLCFNYGALLGYLQITGSFNLAVALPLYLSGIFHTIVYDTIYAFQDIKDDKKVGVKSTAIKFEKHAKSWLTLYSVATSLCLAVTGISAGCGNIFYLISVSLGFLHLLGQVYFLEPRNRSNCWRTFNSNKWYGLIVLTGIVLDRLGPKKEPAGSSTPGNGEVCADTDS